MTKKHFDALDALRGVAATFVLVSHAVSLTYGAVPYKKYLAVFFFFALSGFVIAHAYERRLRATMSFREFIGRRLIRLYPLIFLGAALGIIAYEPHLTTGPRNIAAIAAGFIVLPFPLYASFSFGLFPLNPPEWSLFFELIAYAAFAIIAVRLSDKRLMAAWLVFMVATSLCGYLYPEQQFVLSFFGASGCFIAGVLIWRVQFCAQAKSISLPMSALASGLVACCAIPNTWGFTSDLIVMCLVIPIIVGVGARTAGTHFGRVIGELSYPIYILHWPILVFVSERSAGKLDGVFTVLISCSCALAISWMALEGYDKPLRRWLTEEFFGRPINAKSNASPLSTGNGLATPAPDGAELTEARPQ